MATMPVGNLIGGKLATDLPLPVQSPQIAANLVDPLRSDGVLAQSGAASPVTGTTNETTLATIVVPAGAMGLNGVLRIRPKFTYTGSTNLKTLRVRLGGSTLWSGTNASNASNLGSEPYIDIQNRNSVSSQIGMPADAAGVNLQIVGAFLTAAIDTSAAQNLTITGQLASSGETITLEAYNVEILVA